MGLKRRLRLIIDSLNYSHVKESPVDLMPFLSELKKKGMLVLRDIDPDKVKSHTGTSLSKI